MAFADDASWFLPAVFESFTPLFESRFEDRLIKQNKSRFFGDSCRGAPPFLDEGSAFENESLDGVLRSEADLPGGAELVGCSESEPR